MPSPSAWTTCVLQHTATHRRRRGGHTGRRDGSRRAAGAHWCVTGTHRPRGWRQSRARHIRGGFLARRHGVEAVAARGGAVFRLAPRRVSCRALERHCRGTPFARSRIPRVRSRAGWSVGRCIGTVVGVRCRVRDFEYALVRQSTAAPYRNGICVRQAHASPGWGTIRGRTRHGYTLKDHADVRCRRQPVPAARRAPESSS